MFHTLLGKEMPIELIHHSAVILNPKQGHRTEPDLKKQSQFREGPYWRKGLYRIGLCK